MLLMTVILQAASSQPGTQPQDVSRAARPIELNIAAECRDRPNSDEIIVCAHRTSPYRLPLPVARAPSERVRGEGMSGMAALTPASPCGIFAGERSCTKSEAAEFGYGNGRNPISFLTKVIGKIVDPDAD